MGPGGPASSPKRNMNGQVLLLLLAGLLLRGPTAAASGLNFAWDACLSEGGGQNAGFACNTNAGSRSMYASFILAQSQENFIGIEATVNIAVAEALPQWWQFRNADACRRQSLSASFEFLSDPNTSCTDPWTNLGTGGIGAVRRFWTTPQAPTSPLDVAQVRLVAAVPSTVPVHLQSDTEYYCFKLTINYAKTAGASTCAGCSMPACIVLSEVRIVQNDNTTEILTQPALSNVLSWQATGSCQAEAPTQNMTWGQILSLYR